MSFSPHKILLDKLREPKGRAYGSPDTSGYGRSPHNALRNKLSFGGMLKSPGPALGGYGVSPGSGAGGGNYKNILLDALKGGIKLTGSMWGPKAAEAVFNSGLSPDMQARVLSFFPDSAIS